MSLPVVMLVFNRPDLTRLVFEAVVKYRPKRLLIVADGPRTTHPNDAAKCEATRRLFNAINWDCQIERNYADVNMGCRLRVATGLDWAFDRVEEAIILEDDCLPSQDFFPYCEELLQLYRDDPRVMMISGTRFFPLPGNEQPKPSYGFSRYTNIWGWATWRRAWKAYDLAMKQWPECRSSGWLKGFFTDWWPRVYWTRIFDRAANGRLNTWDYQWLFAVWRAGGYCAVPASNLVSNIGFTAEATHRHTNPWYASLQLEPLPLPFVHPKTVVCSDAFDALVERHCQSRELSSRVAERLKSTLSRLRLM